MTSKNILIHVVTGDGKGKTTSVLGLSLRAIGAGKKVKLIQFMKKCDFSEHKAIKKYKLPIEVACFGIGFYKILGDKHTETEHKQSCEKAWAAAKEAINSNKYDLIILDEINVAIGFGLLNVNDVIEALKPSAHLRGARGGKNNYVDIILTGRKAPAKIKKIAHLVSEIKNVKHYFDEGLEARKGIEY